jgi:hypothetical protein
LEESSSSAFSVYIESSLVSTPVWLEVESGITIELTQRKAVHPEAADFGLQRLFLELALAKSQIDTCMLMIIREAGIASVISFNTVGRQPGFVYLPQIQNRYNFVRNLAYRQ